MLLYILRKENDKGLLYPEIVSLEEAQKVYNEKCEEAGDIHPSNLADVTEPTCFADENWEDFLWVVGRKDF